MEFINIVWIVVVAITIIGAIVGKRFKKRESEIFLFCSILFGSAILLSFIVAFLLWIRL